MKLDVALKNVREYEQKVHDFHLNDQDILLQ